MAKIRLQRARCGTYTGTIALGAPDVDGVVTVSARGSSNAEALAKAALVAEQIAGDPILMEVLPESTLANIAAIKLLSTAAMQGQAEFDEAWSGLRGPGRDRLARALRLDAREADACGDVGFLPFAALAAKYGPTIAKAAYKKVDKAIKNRRAKKAKAAAAARTRAALQARAARQAPPPVAPEESEEYEEPAPAYEPAAEEPAPVAGPDDATYDGEV